MRTYQSCQVNAGTCEDWTVILAASWHVWVPQVQGGCDRERRVWGSRPASLRRKDPTPTPHLLPTIHLTASSSSDHLCLSSQEDR